jgi:hypothetical protein
VLSKRVKGEPGENMDEAIACHRASPQVLTRAALPHDWAHAQMNLEIALGDRVKGERGENVEESIASTTGVLGSVYEGRVSI